MLVALTIATLYIRIHRRSLLRLVAVVGGGVSIDKGQFTYLICNDRIMTIIQFYYD